MPCLEDNTLLAFLGGRLGPEEQRLVEDHVASCAECRWLISMAAAAAPARPAPAGPQDVTADAAPASLAATPLGPGSVINGTYRLERLIGRGGMGAVYAAAHLHLPRQFAITILAERLRANAEAMAPEQTCGRSAEVDPRTDLFALGNLDQRLQQQSSPRTPPAAVDPSVAPLPPIAATLAEAATSPTEPPQTTTVATIPRALLFGSGHHALIHTARIIPSRGGFRVFGVRPGSLWARLGIVNGDRIELFDGERPDSPESCFATYKRVREKSTITIDLRRAGLRHTIVVRLV